MGQYRSPICILGLYSLGGRKSWRLGKKILQTMCSWHILFSGRCRLGDVWGALNSGKPATTSRVAWPDCPPGGQSPGPTCEPNGGLLELSAPQTSPKRHQQLNRSMVRTQDHRLENPNKPLKNFFSFVHPLTHMQKDHAMIIWVYGTSQHITWVFLPSSSADLAVGLSNRWFFKPGLKTFNSPFLLTQRRSLTFNNIMNGYLQHDW